MERLQCRFLTPARHENRVFSGAWAFWNKDGGAKYLLSKNGCSVLLRDAQFRELERGTPGRALCETLSSRGLSHLSGAPNRLDREMPDTADVRPDYFVVDLTRACNFNCAYCFRDLSDSRTIDRGTLRDICGAIDRAARDEHLRGLRIQLWGGEPLCAMDRIRDVLQYFKDKPYAVGFDLETNASLATEEIARELFEHRVRVGVSLDGSPAQHDAQRVFCDGKPTSDAVLRGVRALQSAYGKHLGGICVVTKKNHRELGEMAAFWRELGLSGIKCNLVRDNPNAPEKSLALDAEQTAEFARELYSLWEAYSLLGGGFSEGNLEMRWANLTRRANENCCLCRGCTGGRRIVSFDAKGDIYPCEMMDYPEQKLGSIYDPSPIAEQIAASLPQTGFAQRREKRECAECPWRYFCRGGCTSRVRYLGRPNDVDETECRLNQIWYPRLVERLLRLADAGRAV